MRLFRRKRYPFTVTVYLDGRHPYIEGQPELNYPSRDVKFLVQARNWKDAERKGLIEAKHLQYWTCHVRCIEHGDTRT